MTRRIQLIVLLVSVALLAGGAMARERERRGEKGRGEDRQLRRGEGKRQGAGLIERLEKVIDLTKEQKAQIRKILRKHRQAMRGGSEKNRQALRGLREQLKKADRDEKKAIREKIEKLMAKRRGEFNEGLMDRIREVLTDEQREKLEKLRDKKDRGRGRDLPMFRGLDLTQEQIEKVKAINAEAREATRRIAKERMAQLKKVLTEEQLEKLRKRMKNLRRGGQRGEDGHRGEGDRRRGRGEDRGRRGDRD